MKPRGLRLCTRTSSRLSKRRKGPSREIFFESERLTIRVEGLSSKIAGLAVSRSFGDKDFKGASSLKS